MSGELFRNEAEWQSRDVMLSDGLEEAAKMNGFQYEIEFRGSLLFNLLEGTLLGVYLRYFLGATIFYTIAEFETLTLILCHKVLLISITH